MSASSEASNLSFDESSIVDPGISSLDQILPELVGDLISKHADLISKQALLGHEQIHKTTLFRQHVG